MKAELTTFLYMTNVPANAPLIDIALATYQGERFLSDQISSILNQSHQNIHLWIRDDGSKDNTLALLYQKKQEHPDKITLLPSNTNLGIPGNFSTLLESTTADYIMLSDQDDVWLPEKIATTLHRMHEMEKQYGKSHPLLVHTDLHVVDQSLNQIHPSFWTYTQLFPQKGHPLHRLLMQNVVTGCTVMMNRALLNLALPIPSECVMHDWWIGVVAAALGHIGIVNEPTLLYRQHNSNILGAQQYNLISYVKKIVSSPNEQMKKALTTLDKQKCQANQIIKRYHQQLTASQLELLSRFCELDPHRRLRSLFWILKYRFFKQNVTRTLLTFCLFMPFVSLLGKKRINSKV